MPAVATARPAKYPVFVHPASRSAPQPGTSSPQNDDVFETLYTTLRAQALLYLHRERAGHSLSPTLLVHETYLSLARSVGPQPIDPKHFAHLASRVMRNWLVDWARRRSATMRGGEFQRIDLADADLATSDSPVPNSINRDPVKVILVARAMERLEATSPVLARIVDLRYFAGFDEDETAAILGISVRQTRRNWAKARGLLVSFVN